MIAAKFYFTLMLFLTGFGHHTKHVKNDIQLLDGEYKKCVESVIRYSDGMLYEHCLGDNLLFEDFDVKIKIFMARLQARIYGSAEFVHNGGQMRLRYQCSTERNIALLNSDSVLKQQYVRYQQENPSFADRVRKKLVRQIVDSMCRRS